MKVHDQIVSLSIATDDGVFIARYSSSGLAALSFPKGSKPVANPESTGIPAQIAAWHRLTTAAVKHVLAGRAAGELPPLDLSAGTEFQRAVWQAMRRLQTGQTNSYGELARAISRPKAVRAVGGACGANPIPLLVPCHRVLAAGGRIGGFSGGLDWKRKLLAREHVAMIG